MTTQVVKTTENLPTTTETVTKVGIIRPIVTPTDALAAWKEYETLKTKIATPSDIQRIKGKDFLKKSFWRKMAKFFGLSLGLVSETETDGTWFVVYRATARTGDFADGDGACSTEKFDKYGNPIEFTSHDARATAHTRAKNRAIADLIGGGEVTAEEISVTNGYTTHSTNNKVSNSQLPRLFAAASEHSWTNEQVKAEAKAMFGVTSRKDLTTDQINKLVTIIQTTVA